MNVRPATPGERLSLGAEHEPGEAHRYELRCTVCGEYGTVRVSVVPDVAPDLSSAAGQPLNPDQVHQWPDHAGFTDEDARP